MTVPVVDRMRDELIKEAREMRKQGRSHKLIARRLGIGVATIWEWTSDIRPFVRGPQKSKVGYDAYAQCWCIYIFQKVFRSNSSTPDPQHGIDWWPLEWMGWPIKEMAQAYLDKHGDYGAKEGPCTTTA